MSDKSAPQVRERMWVEKFDHTVDPPRLEETVFIENGEVVGVTRHDDAQEPAPTQEP